MTTVEQPPTRIELQVGDRLVSFERKAVSGRVRLSPAERDRIEGEARRLQDRWARSVTLAVQRLLARQRRVVLEKMNGQKARKGTRFWQPPKDAPVVETKRLAVEDVWDDARWNQEFVDELLVVGASLYQEVAAENLDELEALYGEPVAPPEPVEPPAAPAEPPPPPGVDPLVYAAALALLLAGDGQATLGFGLAAALATALAKRAVAATMSNDTTKRNIDDVIEGVYDGADTMVLSPADQFLQLLERVGDAFDKAADGRARQIGQWFAAGGINEAADVTAIQVGRPSRKYWLSMRDSRVREAHWDTDGQIRDWNEPFDVDGHPMQYPGDLSAPIHLTINCRCVLLRLPPRGWRRPNRVRQDGKSIEQKADPWADVPRDEQGRWTDGTPAGDLKPGDLVLLPHGAEFGPYRIVHVEEQIVESVNATDDEKLARALGTYPLLHGRPVAPRKQVTQVRVTATSDTQGTIESVYGPTSKFQKIEAELSPAQRAVVTRRARAAARAGQFEPKMERAKLGWQVTVGDRTDRLDVTRSELQRTVEQLGQSIADDLGGQRPKFFLYATNEDYLVGLGDASYRRGGPPRESDAGLPDARAFDDEVHVSPWVVRDLGELDQHGNPTGPLAWRQVAHETAHTQSGSSTGKVRWNTGLQAIVEEGGAEILSIEWASRRFGPNLTDTEWSDTYGEDGDRASAVRGVEAIIRRHVYSERTAEVLAQAIRKNGWDRQAVLADVQRVFTGSTDDREALFDVGPGTTVRFRPEDPTWTDLLASAPTLRPVRFQPSDDPAWDTSRERAATLLAWLVGLDAGTERKHLPGQHNQLHHGRRLNAVSWGYSHRNSTWLTGESAHLMGLEGWERMQTRYPEIQAAHTRQARSMLSRIAADGPIGETLFSGHRMDPARADELQPGATFDLPLTATGNRGIADTFTSLSRRQEDEGGDGKQAVIFEFQLGTHGYGYSPNRVRQEDPDLAGEPGFEHRWDEAIVAGRFEVTRRWVDDRQPWVTRIAVRQVAVFDPHADGWVPPVPMSPEALSAQIEHERGWDEAREREYQEMLAQRAYWAPIIEARQRERDEKFEREFEERIAKLRREQPGIFADAKHGRKGEADYPHRAPFRAYHATSPESAERIRSEGFAPGDSVLGQQFGPGVYLGDGASIDFWAYQLRTMDESGERDVAVLEVDVDAPRTLELAYPRHGSTWAFELRMAGRPDLAERYEALDPTPDRAPGGHSDPLLAALVRDAGYDALDVPNQVIVFDPKRVRVREEKGLPVVGLEEKHGRKGEPGYELLHPGRGNANVLSALAAHPINRQLGEAFSEAGFSLFLVGGSVRDALGGTLDFDDLDYTTDARPDDIKRIVGPLGPLWTIGEEFGTIGVQIDGNKVEVTTFRTEVYDPESRKPTIGFGETIRDDLERRDLTINAMALTVASDGEHEVGSLVDPFGGREALSSGVLRTPADPKTTMAEDPLRQLRAIRFAAKRGDVLDPEVAEAIELLGIRLDIVTPERKVAEMRKIMAAGPKTTARAIRLANELGVEQHLFGNLDTSKFVAKRIEMLADDADQATILAVMAMNVDDGRSRMDARRAAYRSLTLSNDEVADVEDVLRLHRELAFYTSGAASDRVMHARVRKLVRDARPESVKGALTVTAATHQWSYALDYAQRTSEDPRLRDPVPISGRDLIAAGLKPGPDLGWRLARAEEAFVLDGSLSRGDLLRVAMPEGTEQVVATMRLTGLFGTLGPEFEDGHDRVLERIVSLHRKDGKPKVLTEAELDEFDGAEMWRGMKVADDGPKERRDPAGNLRNGPFYAGMGVHGNGIYTWFSPYADHQVLRYRSMKRAAEYAEGRSGGFEPNGQVVRMKLRRDARMTTEDAAEREMLSVESRNDPDVSAIVQGDVGRWAALMGYDVVMADRATQPDIAPGIAVVLNRTVLVVSDRTRTVAETDAEADLLFPTGEDGS